MMKCIADFTTIQLLRRYISMRKYYSKVMKCFFLGG